VFESDLRGFEVPLRYHLRVPLGVPLGSRLGSRVGSLCEHFLEPNMIAMSPKMRNLADKGTGSARGSNNFVRRRRVSELLE
jgi:hypothetical protein